jgi:gliding motility-associated lipoprotein GldH
LKTLPYLLFLSTLVLSGCAKVNVFEKNIAFREHEWSSAEKPQVAFEIEDTTVLYNVYIVFRHADAYNYNNVWLRCTVITPDSQKRTQQYELTLANNKDGWLGSGMDDIYEHRILIQKQTKFSKPGTYQFQFEQVMREDPLEHVLNVGLRIEKATP